MFPSIQLSCHSASCNNITVHVHIFLLQYRKYKYTVPPPQKKKPRHLIFNHNFRKRGLFFNSFTTRFPRKVCTYTPSCTRTTVVDGHNFSAVRRQSRRLLDRSNTHFYILHLHLALPFGVIPPEFRRDLLHNKTRVPRDIVWRDPVFSCFRRTPTCDGQTDGLTHNDSMMRHSGKNHHTLITLSPIISEIF